MFRLVRKYTSQSHGRRIGNHTLRMVPFRMSLSELSKYSMTGSIALSLCEDRVFCKFILECKPRRCSSNVNCPSKLTVYAFVFTLRLRIHIPCCCRRLIQSRLRGGRCRVLSLSDRRYSLNPLSQTRIDWVGRDRIRWTFKLSCVWH